MKRIPIIFDCDNTMGVSGCDIDDGLTLLYILGSCEFDLLGITCTFGNNDQETVYENTLRLVKGWGREDIPVFKGAMSKDQRESEAAEFLARKSEEYKDELVVIATGSMSNLYQAKVINEDFFKNVKAFSLMGGIVEDFYVNGKKMNELNLSCDPLASYTVLAEGREVMIATAENSLKSFFDKEKMYEKIDSLSPALLSCLKPDIDYWFDCYSTHWNLNGFVNWDVMAAVQLIHKEFFDKLEEGEISPSPESLKTGLLVGAPSKTMAVMPVISKGEDYFNHVIERFAKADINIAI